METFLVLNGYEIVAPIEEQERIILDVASSKLEREYLTDWLRSHVLKQKD
jgi:death-on-curing protein